MEALFHALLTSALDGTVCLVSRHRHLTSGKEHSVRTVRQDGRSGQCAKKKGFCGRNRIVFPLVVQPLLSYTPTQLATHHTSFLAVLCVLHSSTD